MSQKTKNATNTPSAADFNANTGQYSILLCRQIGISHQAFVDFARALAPLADCLDDKGLPGVHECAHPAQA